MPYTFIPPTAEFTPYVNAETPPLARRLFRHYGAMNCGRSVLRLGGVYRTVDNPDQITLAAATEVYLGGHVYIVDDATGLALIAAGYGGISGGRLWSDLTDNTWGEESTRLWWSDVS